MESATVAPAEGLGQTPADSSTLDDHAVHLMRVTLTVSEGENCEKGPISGLDPLG